MRSFVVPLLLSSITLINAFPRVLDKRQASVSASSPNPPTVSPAGASPPIIDSPSTNPPDASSAEAAILTISLDSSDGATTISIPLDTTVITNFFNRATFGTSVNQQGIFCGGFQDGAASILIGRVFDSGAPGEFAANGLPSIVEAYFCSRNKMAVEKRGTGEVIPGGPGSNARVEPGVQGGKDGGVSVPTPPTPAGGSKGDKDGYGGGDEYVPAPSGQPPAGDKYASAGAYPGFGSDQTDSKHGYQSWAGGAKGPGGDGKHGTQGWAGGDKGSGQGSEQHFDAASDGTHGAKHGYQHYGPEAGGPREGSKGIDKGDDNKHGYQSWAGGDKGYGKGSEQHFDANSDGTHGGKHGYQHYGPEAGGPRGGNKGVDKGDDNKHGHQSWAGGDKGSGKGSEQHFDADSDGTHGGKHGYQHYGAGPSIGQGGSPPTDSKSGPQYGSGPNAAYPHGSNGPKHSVEHYGTGSANGEKHGYQHYGAESGPGQNGKPEQYGNGASSSYGRKRRVDNSNAHPNMPWSGGKDQGYSQENPKHGYQHYGQDNKQDGRGGYGNAPNHGYQHMDAGYNKGQ